MTVPTVAVTCRASGQNGVSIPGAVFVFKLNQTELYNGFVVPSEVTGTADINGTVVVQLFPNVLGTVGSLYKVNAIEPVTGRRFLKASASVPNAACDLMNILTDLPPAAIDGASQAVIDARAARDASGVSAAASGVSASASAASAAAALASQAASGTSATNSATANTNAGLARDAAVVARLAAELALDSFDDRYLGAKAVAPTLDNDGNALLVGALYFDTVIGAMRFYSGAVWVSMSNTAATITNKPAAGITETNVQAALDGLDVRKAALATLAASTGAALMGWIRNALNAVVRTIAVKLLDFPITPQDFGAIGDGVADDTTAFIRLTAAVNLAGSGNVLLPPLNYKVIPPVAGALCAFANLIGIKINATGATITDANTYGEGQIADLFRFTACQNIAVARPKIVTQQAAIAYTSILGLSSFVFFQGCTGIEVDAEISGGQYGMRHFKLSTDGDSLKSKQITARLKTTRVHYPYAGQFSGDNADVTLETNRCGRNFFLYGVKANKLKVKSVDQQSTSLIKAYSGFGCDGVNVDVYDRDSVACTVAAPLIGLEWGDSTPATHRGIKININAKNPVAAPRGHTVAISKYLDGTTTVDTIGRGHVLDGFILSGQNDNTGVSVNHVNPSLGSFAAPDVFRNFSVVNFSGLGLTSNIFAPLTVLSGNSVFENVTSEQNIFTSNGTAGKVVFIGCSALSFTANTASTDTHDYVSCNISGGALQNAADNKNFINTLLVGALTNSTKGVAEADRTRVGVYSLKAVKLLQGDLTGTTNIFLSKHLAVGGQYRLKYFLIADQADGNPATRKETIGIKTFSIIMNTSGVPTLQLPVADEVTQRFLNLASIVTVSLVSGSAAGAFIAASCSAYNLAGARAVFDLEVLTITTVPALSAA